MDELKACYNCKHNVTTKCNDCVDLSLFENKINSALPNLCTVEQYEEITGGTFVGLVWARYSPGGPSEKKWSYWEPEDYPDVLNDPVEKQLIIVQTGKPAPNENWRPG